MKLALVIAGVNSHPLRPFGIALALLLVAALFANAQDFVRVKRVVDGDTLILESGERVRLLGVNTPEIKHGTKQAEAFGVEAAEFTRGMVEGKLVRLKFDSNALKRDKHSRTLAYVFLEDGTFLNAEIIRQGYGFAVRNVPPLEYEFEFVRLEMKARKHRRGMWANEAKAQ